MRVSVGNGTMILSALILATGCHDSSRVLPAAPPMPLKVTVDQGDFARLRDRLR
jgi:hypothetical protein